MTESEWNISTNPQRMLEGIQACGRLSCRKARLFAAACCRRIWHLLPDERSRRAIDVAERYADGQVTDDEVFVAGMAAAEVSGHDWEGIPGEIAWRAAQAADHLLPLSEEAWRLNLVWAMVATAMEGEQLVNDGASPEVLEAWSDQSVESGRPMAWTEADPEAALAITLREIHGPIPFRPVAIDPSLFYWNGGTIKNLAQAAYDERAMPSGNLDMTRLAILANALEMAGCTDVEILAHLREQGSVHVRGCWVIDLLLGKS